MVLIGVWMEIFLGFLKYEFPCRDPLPVSTHHAWFQALRVLWLGFPAVGFWDGGFRWRLVYFQVIPWLAS